MRKYIGKIKDVSEKRRQRRRLSARKILIGTAERPRICVNRSNKNIFVQVVDDSTSKTLFSVQTFGKNATAEGNGLESAKSIGVKIAEGFKGKKIEQAVFDRCGCRYTGALAALADSIRGAG